MRKSTKEKMLQRCSRCPGWHSLIEEIVDIAEMYSINLKSVIFEKTEGLRVVYPQKGGSKPSQEALEALNLIVERCKNLCWECGCDVEGTCVCQDCCEVPPV